MTRRRGWYLVLVVFMVAAATFALGSWVRGSPAAPRNSTEGVTGSRPHPGQPLPTFGEAPFGGALRVSLSEALEMIPYQAWLPDAPLASDASISSVWIRPTDNLEVVIEYLSGVRVDLRAGPEDPVAHYSGLATQLGAAVASLQTVHGVTALVIPQNFPGDCPPGGDFCIPPQDNVGSVDLVLNGTQVTTYGHFPAEDLMAVAESLARR